MAAQITQLIDKQDTKEIVRDQIAIILAEERDNQMSLALTAGEDPALWDFGVYKERYYPWPNWQNDDNVRPLVNVSFESSTIDLGASNMHNRQTEQGKFNIDIYARGLNRTDGTGQISGDKDAALTADRITRLVRNIIMSGQYTQLALGKPDIGIALVANRNYDSIDKFIPQLDDQNAIPYIAMRFRMNVRYIEVGPEVVPEILEIVNVDWTLSPSGELISRQYDFDLPPGLP